MYKDKYIKKRLVVELPIEKHTEIKTAASNLGLTIKDFIDKAIRAYIDKLREED